MTRIEVRSYFTIYGSWGSMLDHLVMRLVLDQVKRSVEIQLERSDGDRTRA
jgi:hypothetical protein